MHTVPLVLESAKKLDKDGKQVGGGAGGGENSDRRDDSEPNDGEDDGVALMLAGAHDQDPRSKWMFRWAYDSPDGDLAVLPNATRAQGVSACGQRDDCAGFFFREYMPGADNGVWLKDRLRPLPRWVDHEKEDPTERVGMYVKPASWTVLQNQKKSKRGGKEGS